MKNPAAFWLCILVCAFSTTACVSNSGLSREIREFGRDCDAKSAGRHAHMDYQGATERALARDASGLRELFRFTESGWCDGALGELHAAMLDRQLRYWGDEAYSTVLRGESSGVQRAVTGELMYMPGFTRSAFPLTYRLASSRHPGHQGAS